MPRPTRPIPLVDESALADALRSGRIAGAGVDVFSSEPPLPASHPLLDAPYTVLAPHVGHATVEAIDRRADIAVDNVLGWIAGSPRNRVA